MRVLRGRLVAGDLRVLHCPPMCPKQLADGGWNNDRAVRRGNCVPEAWFRGESLELGRYSSSARMASRSFALVRPPSITVCPAVRTHGRWAVGDAFGCDPGTMWPPIRTVLHSSLAAAKSF
jgi:hypothetical protein